jgi:hypothetical protein
MGSSESDTEVLDKGTGRSPLLLMGRRFIQLLVGNRTRALTELGIVILMVAAAIIAYKVGYNSAYKLDKVQTAKVANLTSQLNTMQTKISSGDYLSIKQWGVKLPLSTPISAATYSFATNNWDGHQTAFLSTAMMDNSPVCQQFFASNPAQPTFEWITRYNPSDTFKPVEANGNSVTASTAVQQWPNNYRLVGGYVYAFGQSSGSSCPEESIAMQEAFTQAFKSF